MDDNFDADELDSLAAGEATATHVAILSEAIGRIQSDPGAPYAPEAVTAWRRLYRDAPDAYARLRAMAKAAGVRVTEIDRASKWPAKRRERKIDEPSQKPASEGWQSDLIVRHRSDDTVAIPCRVHNLLLILRNDPEFAGRLSWDLFGDKLLIDGREATDVGITQIRAKLERRWISDAIGSESAYSAICAAAHDREVHPVLDYLDGLRWDGRPRVLSFLHDFLGTPDDAYHRDVSRVLFVSAERRVRNPGCQVDTMTILQGAQGIGKTQLWRTLFDPWHSEIIDSLNDKDFFSSQRGIWCADFGELDQFSKAETSRIKQVLTIRADHYRAPYARQHTTYPRQTIFVGGTNADAFNSDATGARRFLPVRVVQRIDVERVARARDQLWAEAVVLSRQASERWWEVRGAEAPQESIYITDSWEEILGAWLAGRESTTTSAALVDGLGVEAARQTRWDQTRVGNVLRRLGWTHTTRERVGGVRMRVYRPGPTGQACPT